MEGCSKRTRGLYAILLPFLGHGHFNAFLHLSRMLATRGVTVIYVTLPSNIQLLRPRAEGWGDLPFYFQDLSVPDSPLPPGRQNLNKVSRDMAPIIFDLVIKMEKPLEALMAELTGREYYESRGLQPPERLVLIYDLFMGWSARVAAEFGVRSFTFNPMSAHMWLCFEAMFWDAESTRSLPEIGDGVSSMALPDFVTAALSRHMDFTRMADGVLVNTFFEMEPKFLGHLKGVGVGGDGSKPVWAVGPVIDLPRRDKIRARRDAEILEWLDRQSPGSVVYLSFGTESYISPAQVTELALGLEASGQPFLWVLRPPDTRLADGRAAASVEDWKAELLPEGYEKRVEGRCLIETGWAPQAAILAHEATGAFITHCGWNSALESVFAGVPMIALPLQSDQPGNALLLAREAKVAVEMKRSNGVAEKDVVERAVRYLMAAEEMKRRVKALSEAAVAAVSEEGGAAWQNLDSFVEYFS